jgi:anhydro-N-acetylmuramic acid kinase
MDELFIGLMSGTSTDGIDAALLRFTDETPELVATLSAPFDKPLRGRLLGLAEARDDGDAIDALGSLDAELGLALADACQALLKKAGVEAEGVRAIGSHGHTVRHRPDGPAGFTLQIGDANRIAAATGITTVADFRRRDIACGGQGAPLAPAFHAAVFHSDEEARGVVNIGGMSNITVLPISGPVAGFDTGPGNALLDVWAETHLGQPYDEDGHWGAQGRVIEPLLTALLADPYFSEAPPKSTGREHFNLAWLERHLEGGEAPKDVQATLCLLTARSIADAIKQQTAISRLLVCGGGAHNLALLECLREELPDIAVETTAAAGLHPDWVEAAAFAWLARQTLLGRPGNLPEVTGAKRATVLGAIFPT